MKSKLGDLANIDPKSIGRVINNINVNEQAQIRRSSDLRPKLQFVVTLDLSVGRDASNPYIVSQPFNGIYVQVATSTVTQVNMSIGGTDKYATDNAFKLLPNASFYSEEEVKQCLLTWFAQPGAFMSIVFFIGIDFRPGSILTQISGFVTQSEGSNTVTGSLGATGITGAVTVASGSATQICPANPTRGCIDFYTDQSIWVGDNGVNAAGKIGTFIAGGKNFKFKNQGPLWAVADSTTATVSGCEELV